MQKPQILGSTMWSYMLLKDNSNWEVYSLIDKELKILAMRWGLNILHCKTHQIWQFNALFFIESISQNPLLINTEIEEVKSGDCSI